MAFTIAATWTLHVIGTSSRPKRRDQRGQIHKIGGTKMGPPRGNHDERVFCCDAGPTRWQPQQILVGVTNDKPVLTPSLLTTDHVDLPPKQRMEWMGNPNRTVYFYCMECSSLVG